MRRVVVAALALLLMVATVPAAAPASADDDLSDAEIIDRIQQRHPANVPIPMPSHGSLDGGDCSGGND